MGESIYQEHVLVVNHGVSGSRVLQWASGWVTRIGYAVGELGTK
jgi:hypothetical protein